MCNKSSKGDNKQTRITTSISSEAQRNQTSILIRGRENHVFPKPDGHTIVFIESFATKNKEEKFKSILLSLYPSSFDVS